MRFELLASDPACAARRGRLTTARGSVETPVFMPCGTQATVKTLDPRDLAAEGIGLILCNTYHLFLRPGHRVVQALGGLHRFMGWEGAILTDSGGYQVLSLAPLRRISEEGVTSNRTWTAPGTCSPPKRSSRSSSPWAATSR
jgi:queuine tRNA-ribosyltransferase